MHDAAVLSAIGIDPDARRLPGRAGRRQMAALPVPSGSKRHSSLPQCRHPQVHRRRVAPSGTPPICQKRKLRWLNWQQITATPPRSWLNGWRKTCPKASPSSPCPATFTCRIRTSNPIKRAIQQELKCRTVKVRVYFRTRNCWSASLAPRSSKSMNAESLMRRPTPNGNARMRYHAKSEHPDMGLCRHTTFRR